MWTFVIAGIVYLTGVGALLMIRPSYMFTPDGDWKEFGIGQNDDRYTPFPFWLFCLVWSIVSYIVVMLIVEGLAPGLGAQPQAAQASVPTPKNRNNRNVIPEEYDDANAGEAVQLPRGYYVLNKKATKLSGVPKYVYLGEQEP